MNGTRSFSLIGLAAAAIAALAVAGCGGGGGNATASTPQPKTSTGRAATVSVASTGLGNVLVDPQGGRSTCSPRTRGRRARAATPAPPRGLLCS